MSRDAVAKIADSVNSAALPIDHKFAWGQFLDYPQENQQRGVYGTAAAVLILRLNGQDETDRCKGGKAWLQDQLEDEKSRANRKRDFEKLYRLGFAALALRSNGSGLGDQLMEQLLNRRLGNLGWGEYYRDESVRDANSGRIPTAFAFFVLSTFPKFCGDHASRDEVLRWLTQSLRSSESLQHTVERAVAAALAILGAIQSEAPIVGETRSVLIEPLLRYVQQRRDPALWYPHHYSVKVPEEDDPWSNNYVYFPTDSIVAEALLSVRELDRAYPRLWDAINGYALDSLRDGYFRQREHRRPATLDQYWVSRLFVRVQAVEPRKSLPGRAWTSFKRTPLLRVPICLLLALALAIIATILVGAGNGLLQSQDRLVVGGGYLATGVGFVLFSYVVVWLVQTAFLRDVRN
jgi:hypothetical protein